MQPRRRSADLEAVLDVVNGIASAAAAAYLLYIMAPPIIRVTIDSWISGVFDFVARQRQETSRRRQFEFELFMLRETLNDYNGGRVALASGLGLADPGPRSSDGARDLGEAETGSERGDPGSRRSRPGPDRA